METPVQRVVAWREQKRREGYQSLTVWLKAEVKHQIEDLAAQRRQDLGQVITSAIEALVGAEVLRQQATRPDALWLQRLIDERLDLKLPALLGQAQDQAVGEISSTPAEASRLPSTWEYGSIPRAMEPVARQLRKFTCARLAREIGTTPANVHRVLTSWVKKGKAEKVGYMYTYLGK